MTFSPSSASLRRRFTRAIAVILSVAITASAVAPAGAADVWSERRRAPTRLASLPSAMLSALPPISSLRMDGASQRLPARSGAADLLSEIPGELGSVRRVRLPDHGAPRATVLLIQDIHRNTEAQRNIADAVARLLSRNAVSLLALEGAFSSVDLSSYRAFPDAAARRAAADQMLADFHITGPVHAALTAERSVPVVGVDDETLYRDNVEAVRAGTRLRDAERRDLSRQRAALDAEKRAFSPALLRIDAAVEAYEDGSLGLGAYLKTLATTGVPPSGEARRFVSALDLEASLDFHRVEVERSAVLQALLPRLNPRALSVLLEETTGYRAGRLGHAEFYARLKKLCAANGVSLDRFPAMATYLRYVIAADGIDPARLFSALESYRGDAYAAANPTSEHKDIIARSERLHRRVKMVEFLLSPDEWAAATPTRGGSPFESFYRCAVERDRAIGANLIAAIEREKASSAVLVLGGFHAPGLERALTRAGVAVVTFVPRVTKVDVASGSAYLSVFTQEKAPLDTIFEGRKLFLAEEVLSAAPRARLGLAMAADAARRGATPLAVITGFLQRGLALGRVTIERLASGVVRISGARAGAEPMSIDVDGSGRAQVVARAPGVWDLWRPLFLRLRAAVGLGRAAPRTMRTLVTGLGAVEELIARPLLFFAAAGLGSFGIPFVAAVALVAVIYVPLYGFGLHRLGIIARPDEEAALTRAERRQLLIFAAVGGAVQVALAAVSPALAVVVIAVMSGVQAYRAFDESRIPEVERARFPVRSDAEARAMLNAGGKNISATLPSFRSALRWAHDHPSPAFLKAMLPMYNRPWVQADPETAAAIRREVRYHRYLLHKEGGPSERVRLMVELEQVLVSETHTFAQKGAAIRQILDNPGSGALPALSDTLITYRRRHPRLAALLIDAIRQIRMNGVLTPQSVTHDSMLGIARRAVEDSGERWEHFQLVFRDSGQTLELRWQMPPGQRLDRLELVHHRLRTLFNEQNTHLDPDMTIVPDAASFPAGNAGMIRLAFHPDIANMSDFQRTMGVNDFVVGRNGRYVPRSPLQITDQLEERARLFLDGLDAGDPERAAFIEEVFGTGDQPGMDASIRDVERFGMVENVRIESYPENDPNTGRPRADERGQVALIKEMGQALPYLTHYIPEFAVDAWAFFGRGADGLYTTGWLKGFLRGHVADRDHMVLVSRDTVGWRHWNEVHNRLSELTGMMSSGTTLEPEVRFFRTMRLVFNEWLRERYMLAPAIRLPGVIGFLRYRDATVEYDSQGRFVEMLAVYDGDRPGARRIGWVMRDRDLSAGEAPIYRRFRGVDDADWKAVDNRDVETINDRPDDGMYAHILKGIYQQFRSSPILSGDNGQGNETLNVTLIDETGIGSFDYLTSFALETFSHADEQDVPPTAELAALRRMPVPELTVAQAARWEQLEKEYLAIRVSAAARPVETRTFIASPPTASAGFGMLINEYNYLTVTPVDLTMDFGMSLGDATATITRTATAADNSPHLLKVNTTAVTGRGYRGRQRPEQPEFNMGTPIVDRNVPLILERPSIQIADYVRDLYVYNGTIEYYEKEYERLSVKPLLFALTDGDSSLRGLSLNALAGHELPATVAGLVAAARGNAELVPGADAVGMRALSGVLGDAVAFNPIGTVNALLNYEILLSYKALLTGLARPDNPLSGVQGMAARALETLETARERSEMMGLSLDRYLALNTDQKEMLRSQGVFLAPLVATEVVLRGTELERAAGALGLERAVMALPTWQPPTAAEAARWRESRDGGRIPFVTRHALPVFTAVLGALGVRPAAAIAAYRLWGAAGVEEIFFTGVPAAITGGLFLLGAPAWGLAAVFAAAFIGLRISFVFAHPSGRRFDPALIAGISLVWALFPFFLDGGVVVAIVAPLITHVIVNIRSERALSPEARLAARVAGAFALVESGRAASARTAITEMITGAPVNLGVAEAPGTSLSLRHLSSVLDGRSGFDARAFREALARELPAALGRANVSEQEAGILLQRLAGVELGRRNAPTIEQALSTVIAADAQPGRRFVHIVIDEANESRAGELVRIALAKRASADEDVLISAATDELARRLAPTLGQGRVSVRSLGEGLRDLPTGRSLLVSSLPATWNGARPRALIVPDGIDVDVTGLPEGSAYRTAAIILINLALRAVILPPIGDLERTARLIASQA